LLDAGRAAALELRRTQRRHHDEFKRIHSVRAPDHLNLFFASPKEQQAQTRGDHDRRGHDHREAVTKCAIVGGAPREPRVPARVEVGIAFGLQWHQALTSARLR
jgi:hypothetical protein